MLLYGELYFDEEERVESHLDACGECRTALEREKASTKRLSMRWRLNRQRRCCESAARNCTAA